MSVNVFQKYAPEDLSEFSIREIKYARARFSLLNALFGELQKKPANEIKVKDLCRIAVVSEPSFYNYFPQKDDLFYYFVGLWSIDSYLYSIGTNSGLEALIKFYSYTGKVSEAHPYLMKELLAYQARANIPSRSKFVPAITHAEKVLAFGNVKGLEKIPGDGLRTLIFQNLKKAIENKELSKNTKLPEAALAVGGIFFGVAGLCASSDFENLSNHYTSSLKIVFDGLKKK